MLEFLTVYGWHDWQFKRIICSCVSMFPKLKYILIITRVLLGFFIYFLFGSKESTIRIVCSRTYMYISTNNIWRIQDIKNPTYTNVIDLRTSVLKIIESLSLQWEEKTKVESILFLQSIMTKSTHIIIVNGIF